MSKKPTAKSTDHVAVEYADLTGLLPWITQFAFFLSLGLVIARCTIMESLRDVTPVSPGTKPAPGGPGAAAILVLNLICCLPAILILLRRALDKTYYLHSGIAHLLAGLLGIWAILSTAWASDKYAAFINGSTLIAAAAMFWSTAQLVRSWSRLRLVSGACLGVLLICTAQGLIYRYIDLPDNLQHWKEIRLDEFRQRGWEETSFTAQQFERKFINGEIIGFYASSNTMAAMLVFMGIVAAGVAIQRLSNRDEPGWAGAITAAIIPALFVVFLTQSKTAYLTPVIAGIMLFAIPRVRKFMLARRTVVFSCAVALIALAVAVVIGHGVYHHSLPGDSLNFRWKYWTGSWGVLKSHPWIGTGWSNFGLHYLQFRLPEASEEIKDPHNFIVRFFCELGIVGGMIALLMLARGAWEITFPAAPPAPSSKPKAPARLGESLRPIIVIAMLAMAINIVASIEFHQDKSWVFLELMKRLLWLGLLVVAFAVAALRSSKDPVIDDRPAPWVIHGILVAIAIFLLHNTVDFSMFENGPMMLLALLCGAITGVRHPTSHGSRGRSPVAAYICAASAVGWCAIAIVVGVPVFEAEAKARDADEHVRQGNLRLAAEKHKAAFYEAPVRNTDFAVRSAEVYAHMPDGEAPFAQMISEARGHNPKDFRPQLLFARYHISRDQAMEKSTQIDSAYRSTLSIDPNNVDVRLEYAQFLSTVFESESAARQFEQALQYDDQLDKAEPKRLSSARKEQIRERIRELRGE